jgi:hypothetical protein
MCDVRRLVARGLQLRFERWRELHEPLLAIAAQEALLIADGAAALTIGDCAGVPQQHAARMHDQKRRDGQLDLFDVGVRQAIARRLRLEHSAVEHVQAR